MQQFIRMVVWGFSSFCGHVAVAQWAKIGSIDVFGNRKTSATLVRQTLKLAVGDSIDLAVFNPSPYESGLAQIPGVTLAKLNMVCCDTAGHWMLFVGIGETDSTSFIYRAAPTENLKLPEIMTTAYDTLNNQIVPAIKAGQATEDDSNGYSLLAYKPARHEQIKFTGFADTYFKLLSEVLRHSMYAEQRAAAAEIIAYGADKKEVSRCLLQAVDDPDDDVRNNATRALGVLAAYGGRHPELQLGIPVAPFIRMINSIVWTDRNKGLMVLVPLTQQRDKKELDQLRQQALSSLIEMAKWEDRGHAMNAFMLLGRIAGVPEDELITKNFSARWPEEVALLVAKCADQQ